MHHVRKQIQSYFLLGSPLSHRKFRGRALCWCPELPDAIILAYLEHHPSDSQRVYVPGANIFAYLRVGGSDTEEDSQLVRI